MHWIAPLNNPLKLVGTESCPPSAFSFTRRTNMTWTSCLIYSHSNSLTLLNKWIFLQEWMRFWHVCFRMCVCVCVFPLTVWMCQWLRSAGIWTCSVFLSTVRFRWVLSRSSFTWCQCWSSSRLPRETRSWPPEDELTPATQRERGAGEKLSCRCHGTFQRRATSPANAEIPLCISCWGS